MSQPSDERQERDAGLATVVLLWDYKKKKKCLGERECNRWVKQQNRLAGRARWGCFGLLGEDVTGCEDPEEIPITVCWAEVPTVHGTPCTSGRGCPAHLTAWQPQGGRAEGSVGWPPARVP